MQHNWHVFKEASMIISFQIKTIDGCHNTSFEILSVHHRRRWKLESQADQGTELKILRL